MPSVERSTNPTVDGTAHLRLRRQEINTSTYRGRLSDANACLANDCRRVDDGGLFNPRSLVSNRPLLDAACTGVMAFPRNACRRPVAQQLDGQHGTWTSISAEACLRLRSSRSQHVLLQFDRGKAMRTLQHPPTG